MRLSKIASSLGESATLRLNDTAASLRAQGEPVIHLGGGEPKGKAPVEALDAARRMLDTGEVRYTPPDGTAALKKAILGYTEQFYGRAAKPENVLASSGAKQAMYACMAAILDPGDEVVFPAPYWVSNPEMVRLAQGRSVIVEPPPGSFVPTLPAIERAVSPATKVILLNSPNNPSGMVYPEELLAGVVELCERRGLWLMLDDIYHRLLFDGRRPVGAWQFARDRSESSRIILINGVSKQFAMTGFRIGWAVAAKDLIEGATKIQSHQTSGPSALSQAAAVGALQGDPSCVESLRATLESARGVMIENLRSIPGVAVTPPDGTFYCFPDFRAFGKSSVELARYLLEKVRVVTVPGIEFGMEGHLRLSFCGSVEEGIEGIRRIRWALDPNGAPELSIGDRRVKRDPSA